MTTIKHVKTVNICGDILTIHWDGNVWVSPSNGQQHAHARDAMREEIESYMSESGEDIDEPDTVAEIDRYVEKMVDAE